LQITFLRGDATVISEDLPGLQPAFNGTEFKVWKTMPEDEHYFGLGDKPGPMDHRNLAFTMWNTDAFGWQESTDPIYKDIPFIFAFRNGASYGVFLDNTYRSSFDFGKERADAYSFGAEGVIFVRSRGARGGGAHAAWSSHGSALFARLPAVLATTPSRKFGRLLHFANEKFPPT
jgi:alpha-glucosidase (family GH31 glycosyl hydrolase)